MTQSYSTVQKIALAGMTIGALMCIVGIFSPYWLVSDIDGPSLEAKILRLGTKLLGVKLYIGLYVVCVESAGEKGCEVMDMDNDNSWFHTVRVAAAGCVLLSAITAGVSLCLACCSCCKRFIVVGFLAFFAACAGAFAVIAFSQKMEVFTSSVAAFKAASLGWGFILCCAGTALLGLTSFIACFSSPENPLRGMVLHPPSMVQVTTRSTQNAYMHLEEQGYDNRAHPGAHGMMTTNGY